MTVRSLYSLLAMSLCVITMPLVANPVLLDWPSDEQEEQQQTVDALQQARFAKQQDILALSGLLGLSQQARQVAQSVLNDQQAALGQQYRVVGRVTQQWAPSLLHERLLAAISHDTDEQLAQLYDALQQPRMVRARALEQQAIQEQTTESYQAYLMRLRAQPPMQERLQLIAELDRAMHFSAMMQRTRQGVYPHLQAVLRGWQPEANWSQALQQQVREFLLYVHRQTPNEEIQLLIAEYQQAPLQQWLQAVQRQLHHAG